MDPAEPSTAALSSLSALSAQQAREAIAMGALSPVELVRSCIAAIEAQACGVAVIASDIPGVREAVIENETAILVPPNEEFALADVIKELIRVPEKRDIMGQAGVVNAREKFNILDGVNRFVKIYESLHRSSD